MGGGSKLLPPACPGHRDILFPLSARGHRYILQGNLVAVYHLLNGDKYRLCVWNFRVVELQERKNELSNNNVSGHLLSVLYIFIQISIY